MVRDQVQEEPFAYESEHGSEASSRSDRSIINQSDSGDENNRSVLWAHNCQEQEDDDSEWAPSEAENEEDIINDEEVTIQPVPVINPSRLSSEEIALLRTMLRIKLKSLQDQRRTQTVKRFEVPKTHPIFSGDPESLENFLMEMHLTHAEWTTGPAASRHNPDFIRKLVDYFQEDSAVRIWFKIYAVERQNAHQRMTWSLLTRALRRDYGLLAQPESKFENFWELKQGNDTIQSYISRKKGAALEAKDNLTPAMVKFGFIRGLRPDLKRHVKIQNPETVEKAQKLAVAYEESTKDTKISTPVNKVSKPNVKQSSQKNENEKKRKFESTNTTTLNPTQRDALSELRKLRDNKCFGCGVAGHRQEKCNASASIKESHQASVKRLKETINGK